MRSQWIHLKERAVKLRRDGNSIKDIRKKLGIPLSTLSGWLKDVPLTATQRRNLERKWKQGLAVARREAVRWHNTQKAARMEEAATTAKETLEKITDDSSSLELALAMLYLGEGNKTRSGLGLGNSDPLIVQFYMRALERLYKISRETLRVELHLRADQDIQESKKFWSKITGIPLKRFLYAAQDQRTKGRPTYPGYHGVCILSGGGIAIQRKLMYLARAFAEKQAL